MTISRQIAEFVYSTDYETFPNQVVDKAKQCLLDSLGVALYGSRFEASKISLKVIKQIGGSEESTILGTPYKAPCPLAAMANGIRAHVADYDDSLVDFGHPSCVLMPATLALAERENIDGRSLITSFILGSEVGSKLGRMMGWRHYETGWHVTGTVGTIGAATAVAKLLNLSPPQIVNALGIAASSAGGLRQNFGTMTKSWHVGHAASAGVMAALLAQEGYSASALALDGETGFIRAFQGDVNSTFLPEALGNPYSLMKIMFKKYPSCHGTHAAVDAVLKLKEQYGFQSEEIEAIECYIRPLMKSVLIYKDPQTELEAKFSVEYCVAAALVLGRLGIAQFTDEVLFHPEVRSLMRKVSVRDDPTLEEIAKKGKLLAPSRVKVILSDGREYTQSVLEARGGPSEPLRWEELEKKFLECAGQVLLIDQAQKALALIRKIEEVDNMALLTEVLIPRPQKT